MNKKDFEFIMAYAEAYGLQDKSVETVLNIIKTEELIDTQLSCKY